MPKCPNCGAEIGEGYDFCGQCGTKLIGLPQDQTTAGSSMEDEVKNVIVRRFDGLKNRDEGTVRAIIDEDYSKFDEWPPYLRLEAPKALQSELGALKVISDYGYELKDFKANVFGNVAIATFSIHYKGTARNRPFEMTSRVTSILRKQDSGWKVVHEHFSRFEEERQWQQPYGQFGRRRGGFPFPF